MTRFSGRIIAIFLIFLASGCAASSTTATEANETLAVHVENAEEAEAPLAAAKDAETVVVDEDIPPSMAEVETEFQAYMRDHSRAYDAAAMPVSWQMPFMQAESQASKALQKQLEAGLQSDDLDVKAYSAFRLSQFPLKHVCETATITARDAVATGGFWDARAIGLLTRQSARQARTNLREVVALSPHVRADAANEILTALRAQRPDIIQVCQATTAYWQGKQWSAEPDARKGCTAGDQEFCLALAVMQFHTSVDDAITTATDLCTDGLAYGCRLALNYLQHQDRGESEQANALRTRQQELDPDGKFSGVQVMDGK